MNLYEALLQHFSLLSLYVMEIFYASSVSLSLVAEHRIFLRYLHRDDGLRVKVSLVALDLYSPVVLLRSCSLGRMNVANSLPIRLKESEVISVLIRQTLKLAFALILDNLHG